MEETCEIQGKMCGSWLSHGKLQLFGIYDVPIIKTTNVTSSRICFSDAAFKETQRKKSNNNIFIIDAREILKAIQL